MILNADILSHIPLFQGITVDELARLDTVLYPHIKNASSGEFLSYPEDVIEDTGIVLEGRIHMISEDFWGNQNIIAEFTNQV